MLTPAQADRLAGKILERERPLKQLRRQRPVFFMSLWRRICPGLNELEPVDAKNLLRAALLEADQRLRFKLWLLLAPLAGAASPFVAKHPWWWGSLGLAGILAAHLPHAWVTRQAVGRRLPEALARGVKVGEV